MSVTTTASEFQRFYADPVAWPEGRFHEEVELRVNGARTSDVVPEDWPADAQVVIENGWVFDGEEWDGCGSLAEHFTKWANAQVTRIRMVQYEAHREAEVLAGLQALGVQIVSQEGS